MEEPEVKEPDEVIVPEEVQDAPGGLIDGGRVLIMVGDPTSRRAIPMTLPDVFQQLFAILGDLDKRLAKLEGSPTEESRIITV
jgi:hypothetical protein